MRSFALLLPLAFSAQGLYSQSFNSLTEFWAASPAKVDQRLSARPLDLSKPLDKKVRGIMDELDQLNQMTTTVYWADGYGSNAHPQKGIGLDGRQLAQLVDTQSESSVDDAIRFILGHEQAHMAQFKYYSNGLDDPQRRRAIECQADILGGLAFVGMLFRERRPPESVDFKSMSTHLVDLALKIGSPEWEDQTQHPRPEQRARAVTLGMLSQLQIVDWQMYQQTHDPDTLQRLKSAEAKFADIIKPPEPIMDWSNTMAKRIVNSAQ
jgi:hypothetical protein